MFATCDVYVEVVHDIEENKWYYEYSVFARPNTLGRAMDYNTTQDFSVGVDAVKLIFNPSLVEILENIIPEVTLFELEPAEEPVTIEYISMIYMGEGNSEDNAKTNLFDQAPNITFVPGDLNRGISNSPFRYLGYTTTTNPAEAVTGIRSHLGTSSSPAPGWFFHLDARYERFGHDVNKGVGGRDIFLYLTKDPVAGSPIKDLFVSHSRATFGSDNYIGLVQGQSNWYTVYKHGDGSTTYGAYETHMTDLTQGTGGLDDIYLWFKR